MQLNHQKKCCRTCGSEIETRSDDGPMASRRMTTKEMVEIMIQIFSPISGPSPEQGIFPHFLCRSLLGMVIEAMMIQKFPQLQTGARVEDLSLVVRHHVSELIQPVLDKLQTIEQRISQAETIATSSVGTVKFMFLDEVAGPVLTSKEIKFEEDKLIRVALIDEKTGNTVDLGSESSLRAEIVLLDASDDSNEKNWTCKDFQSRIINKGDKTMPHFSETQYIDVKEGVAVLRDIKLGHDKRWTKLGKCKLGVILAGNNIKGGVEVREGWTNSFEVRDSRGKLYEKGNPPCLSDPLWKLEKIGRNGNPIERLEENNIKTVKDFLFFNSIDPTRLQKIILGEKRKAEDSASWKAIVKHAKTSRIDDTNVFVHFRCSSESQKGVVFDVVGGLKGLIDKSHYICVKDLSEDDKDVARELLISAFENQNDIISFHDETSLLDRFPHPSNDSDIAAANPVHDGDFSTDAQDGAMINCNFSHDSEQYDVAGFVSSPGSMLFFEQNLVYPTLNLSPCPKFGSWDDETPLSPYQKHIFNRVREERRPAQYCQPLTIPSGRPQIKRPKGLLNILKKLRFW